MKSVHTSDSVRCEPQRSSQCLGSATTGTSQLTTAVLIHVPVESREEEAHLLCTAEEQICDRIAVVTGVRSVRMRRAYSALILPGS